MSRECLTDKQHKYVTIYCDYFCKEGSTDENERMCKGVDLGKVLHNTPINSKHPKKSLYQTYFSKIHMFAEFYLPSCDIVQSKCTPFIISIERKYDLIFIYLI